MSTLREDLLPVFQDARRLIDSDLGLRTHRVFLRTVSWDEGEVGLGAPTTTDLEITPRPKVVPLMPGQVRVDKITPQHSAGGYAVTDLMPRSPGPGEDVYWVIIGPDGVERDYQLRSIDVHPNFRYSLILESLTREDPHP